MLCHQTVQDQPTIFKNKNGLPKRFVFVTEKQNLADFVVCSFMFFFLILD